MSNEEHELGSCCCLKPHALSTNGEIRCFFRESAKSVLTLIVASRSREAKAYMQRGFLLTNEERARKAGSSTSSAQQSAKGKKNTSEQQSAKASKWKQQGRLCSQDFVRASTERWVAKQIPGPTFVNPNTGHESQGPASIYWERLDD